MQRSNTVKTGEIGLVTFLSIRGIYPIDHSDEHGHKSVYYENTNELTEAMKAFQVSCPTCGFAASEFMRSQVQARRMLLDGEI